MILYYTKVIVVLILVLNPNLVLAQDPFLRNVIEPTPTVKPEPTAKFPGYAIYRDRFQRVCQNLWLDGYQDRWNAVIEKVQTQYDSCRNCRLLYKALYCKKTKKQEATPVSMPSTELLASVSELFREIAADKSVALQTVQSMGPIWEELSVRQNPRSDEFFSILIEYLKAPLSEHLDEGLAAMNAEKKAAKKKNLDKLF